MKHSPQNFDDTQNSIFVTVRSSHDDSPIKLRENTRRVLSQIQDNNFLSLLLTFKPDSGHQLQLQTAPRYVGCGPSGHILEISLSVLDDEDMIQPGLATSLVYSQVQMISALTRLAREMSTKLMSQNTGILVFLEKDGALLMANSFQSTDNTKAPQAKPHFIRNANQGTLLLLDPRLSSHAKFQAMDRFKTLIDWRYNLEWKTITEKNNPPPLKWHYKLP